MCAKFDFMLIFDYNPTLSNNKLSCCFVCSRDLFDETTVAQYCSKISISFRTTLSIESTDIRIDPYITPISKFNIILPEEVKEMEDIIFSRQLYVMNEGMLFYS